MKKNKYSIFCLGIVFIMAFNCCKENATLIEIKTAPLESLGYGADTLSCLKACLGKLQEKVNKSFIINNTEDYDSFKSYVSCLEISNWPLIDFEKYTLLSGIEISSGTCGRLLPDLFTIKKTNSKYIFTVTYEVGGYTAFSAIFYWALVGKINPLSQIEFIIVAKD